MFPLPLTNFEEYMLCDDRPAYPMTGVYRLRFAGFLDRPAFESALATAVQRHPFLRTTVRCIRGRRSVWVEQHPDWYPDVQWQANVNSSGFPCMTPLDLTQEPGSRWWVLERDDGHDVIIQVHHCCTDGAGINLVVEDLLVSYALHWGVKGGDVSLRQLDPQRLLRRGAPKLTLGRFLKMAPKQALGLIGVRDFFKYTPVSLTGRDHEVNRATATPETFPGIRTYEFDLDETREISAAAKRLQVTMNTLLIRDLFVTLGVWRKRQAIGTEQDRLRLFIPVNLRGSADKHMPMSNAISMVFLDRRVRGSAYPDLLLKGIHEQMWMIKRFQLQYTYILSIGVARLLPGAISRMARVDKCYATSYFSNLGVVLEQTPLPRRKGRIVSGNVVLESVDVASILRPHTNVGFVAYIYGGRLRIAMHYDSRVIPAEQSGELLNIFTQQIRQSIQVINNSS